MRERDNGKVRDNGTVQVEPSGVGEGEQWDGAGEGPLEGPADRAEVRSGGSARDRSSSASRRRARVGLRVAVDLAGRESRQGAGVRLSWGPVRGEGWTGTPEDMVQAGEAAKWTSGSEALASNQLARAGTAKGVGASWATLRCKASGEWALEVRCWARGLWSR